MRAPKRKLTKGLGTKRAKPRTVEQSIHIHTAKRHTARSKSAFVERDPADSLTKKVKRALAEGRKMRRDEDGWYVDDETGELVGPDPRMEQPLDKEFLDRADIYEGDKLIRRAGRPRSANPKILTTIRFDADLLDWLKNTGPGWQTRANDMLRRAAKLRARPR